MNPVRLVRRWVNAWLDPLLSRPADALDRILAIADAKVKPPFRRVEAAADAAPRRPFRAPEVPLRQVGLAALMCGVLFFYQRNVKEGKGGFEYIYNNLRNNDYDYPDKTRAKMLADESCRLGVYCIGK